MEEPSLCQDATADGDSQCVNQVQLRLLESDRFNLTKLRYRFMAGNLKGISQMSDMWRN